MQSYKTGQVGGRASQVGGITLYIQSKEKNYRTVRDGGNPTKGGRDTALDTALEAKAQLNNDNIT